MRVKFFNMEQIGYEWRMMEWFMKNYSFLTGIAPVLEFNAKKNMGVNAKSNLRRKKNWHQHLKTLIPNVPSIQN